MFAAVLFAKKAQTPAEILTLFLGLVAVFACFALAGYVCVLLPWNWMRNEQRLTADELATLYPRKAWVARSYQWVACVFGLLSLVLLVLGMAAAGGGSYVRFFLFGPTFMAGCYCTVAFYELVAGVSPAMPFGKGRHPPITFFVSRRAPMIAAYRLALAAGLYAALFLLA